MQELGRVPNLVIGLDQRAGIWPVRTPQPLITLTLCVTLSWLGV